MKSAEQERLELEEAKRVAEEARIAAEQSANMEKEERERKVRHSQKFDFTISVPNFWQACEN